MKVRKLRAKYMEAIFQGKKRKQRDLWYKNNEKYPSGHPAAGQVIWKHAS